MINNYLPKQKKKTQCIITISNLQKSTKIKNNTSLENALSQTYSVFSHDLNHALSFYFLSELSLQPSNRSSQFTKVLFDVKINLRESQLNSRDKELFKVSKFLDPVQFISIKECFPKYDKTCFCTFTQHIMVKKILLS